MRLINSSPLIFLSGLLWFLPTPAIAQTTPARSTALPDIPIPPAEQARPATSIVTEERAQYYSSPVTLYPGRSSIIDFSSTNQIITYIQLSDLSHTVYDTNAPIDSGAAHTIILRPIESIDIEGATTNIVPNLVVSTIDTQGRTYTYLFDLYPSPHRIPDLTQPSGLAIAPASEVRETQLFNTVTIRPNVLRTNAGDATLEDIERGLALAIQENYTPADDPIVFTVEEAIALARNGTPLRTAANQLQLDLAILTSLGELGIEADITDLVEGQEAPLSTDELPAPPDIRIETEVDKLI